MITYINLPRDYRPYECLDFCSNVILGGGHILAVGEVLPLLVGMGELPRIWLQAVASPGGRDFVPVVEDSKATHPSVAIEYGERSITVQVDGKVVLCVESKGFGKAAVSKVDFRPLGLNILGSSSQLKLGGMSVSHNTFSNVRVAFALSA